MRNLAIITKDLSPTQNAFYLINTLNKVASDNEYNVMCYTNPLLPTVKAVKFACVSPYYFSSFCGTAVATDIESAKTMLKTNSNITKFLYLWDIEWLRSGLGFEECSAVLRDESLSIIARSESHKKIIENYCNKPVIGILDDWDKEEMEEILWT